MEHLDTMPSFSEARKQWRVTEVVEQWRDNISGFVLSVDAPTKTVYMICLATPCVLMHFNYIGAHIIVLLYTVT